MNRYRTALLAAAIGLASATPPAQADDVHCPPGLGEVTIDGNVLVAAPCRLDGTVVIGNVHLYTGGSLIARNARIDGNVQAQLADFVDIADSVVGGSVQLDELVGDSSSIAASEIDGSIQLVANRSRLSVIDNRVGADIQLFANTGGVTVASNVVDGNLQCKENRPAPTGGDNEVHGNIEDQCASMAAATASDPITGATDSTSSQTGAQAGGNSSGAVSTAPALSVAAAETTGSNGGGGAAGPIGIVLLAACAIGRRRQRAA